MAVTALSATELHVVKNALVLGSGNGCRVTVGRAALSSGTVELDTGLSEVHIFVALGVQTTATEALVLSCQEDLPLASGTVTVDGVLVDEAGASKDGSSEDFNWIAIGY